MKRRVYTNSLIYASTSSSYCLGGVVWSYILCLFFCNPLNVVSNTQNVLRIRIFFSVDKSFLTSIPLHCLFPYFYFLELPCAWLNVGWMSLERALRISCRPQTVPQLKMVCQHVKKKKKRVKMGTVCKKLVN